MRPEAIFELIKDITQNIISKESEEIDKCARWPEESIRALQRQKLTGLVIPRRMGGLGFGMYELAKVCEIMAQSSGSVALCFGMHCVGSAVIAAKATTQQQKDYIRPIVNGEHLTTLALSEPGTGAHFYLPQTQLLAVSADQFLLNGSKSFITNGGHCDSYVVSTVGVEADAYLHQFSCIIVDKSAKGMEWGPEWKGLGMRGNSSRSLNLKDVLIPSYNLLGERGDQLWYVFHVVAPYFLIAMAGTYLGLAQAAFDEARNHLMERSHSHTGMTLSQVNLLQHRLGRMWCKIERTRQLLYNAATEGDKGNEFALLGILAAKAEVAHCVEEIVNEAMTLAGGFAYTENSRFDVLMRDSRAAHIMSPTTDLLYTWIGRSLLDQPILAD